MKIGHEERPSQDVTSSMYVRACHVRACRGPPTHFFLGEQIYVTPMNERGSGQLRLPNANDLRSCSEAGKQTKQHHYSGGRSGTI
jgi:hypothetical protein